MNIAELKPLRSINIKPEYQHLKELPIVEGIEKRRKILKQALITASKIKVK
ncbi:hypothetical protein ABEV41_00160 [Geobacillus thermodenitrificans]|jgi:hypothetical protein|uniref:hypothetical protein n=1 Tax=Geobacillus thermodenitrificans TaxID=33940 RepID=UPI003D1ADF10